MTGPSPLTSRETEVLRLVSTGMSNREIASTLVLSEHTVHRHIANILRKLSQSTRASAATHATRVGLIWKGATAETGGAAGPSPSAVARSDYALRVGVTRAPV